MTDATAFSHDHTYLGLMQRILDEGTRKESRAGATVDLFGAQLRFPLDQGFPLLTTKRVFHRGLLEELLWFLRGQTNVKPLQDRQVKIWDEWADPDGELGPVYGKQWRAFGGTGDYPSCATAWERPVRWDDGPTAAGITSGVRGEFHYTVEDMSVDGDGSGPWDGWVQPPVGSSIQFEHLPDMDSARAACEAWRPSESGRGIDQISQLVKSLRESPGSRRHIVTAWDPRDVPRMALPPCHCLFQFDVTDGRLSCQLYQRSADYFLGVPFNIASYAALTHLLAATVDLEPGDFIHTFGSVHLYEQHLEQARLQLSRDPHPSPTLLVNPGAIWNSDTHVRPEASAEHFTFLNYDPHPAIKAAVNV